MSEAPRTLQDLILRLQSFWADEGCVIQLPYDVEKGAGTMNPETFLRVLEPGPWRVAYVEPSRRPADGRYGENPFRLEKHHQLQVILKPSPEDVQERYIRSLEAIGIPLRDHDLRFEEDNWEAPTLGAWGVGWQVMLDGLEITQFTYFQQAGGQDLPSIPVELTYGLERILMFLTGKESVYDIEWAPGVSYRRVRHRDEFEFSKYYFEEADVPMSFRHFEDHEAEAGRLLDLAGDCLPRLESGDVALHSPEDRALVLAAYDGILRCSHLFNILDARGAISVTERAGYIRRIRRLAVRTADLWVRLSRALSAPVPADRS